MCSQDRQTVKPTNYCVAPNICDTNILQRSQFNPEQQIHKTKNRCFWSIFPKILREANKHWNRNKIHTYPTYYFLWFLIPVTCTWNANLSVPTSQAYSPASFFSMLSITSWRILPFDSMRTALLKLSSLPSLYHFTSVLLSTTSQLRMAFWERVALTSLWTDSLLRKADLAQTSVEVTVKECGSSTITHTKMTPQHRAKLWIY